MTTRRNAKRAVTPDPAGPVTAPAAALALPGSAAADGLRAYGCVFHRGAQRLAVARPGESAVVRFSDHSCLKRIDQAKDGAGVIVREAGDYEISFGMRVAAKAAAPVTFELRTRDGALPGGAMTSVMPEGSRDCRGGAMATLRAGDVVGVAMTSASACEAALAFAALRIKKLS
jgi:hypothetical protein